MAIQQSELVVLLHGMGLGPWSLRRLEKCLLRHGYRVANLSYPSRACSLEELGEKFLPEALKSLGADRAARLHFVTHSMGGIVVRYFLQRGIPPNLGHVVMLGPPNAGSEIVDRLRSTPLLRWITGVNGPRLGTDPQSAPRTAGPWPAGAGRLGVIAGTRSLHPIFSFWIPGQNDGEVSVASTKLEGMADFCVVPCSHMGMAWDASTAEKACAFLRTGRF